MDQNKSNPYIQAVGYFLLQHVGTHPGDAGKILNTDKTIAKSLDEMKKVASAKKVGNCAVLTDQEGFAVVLKYFGIETVASVPAQARPTAPAPISKPQSTDFNISLDDLLEE